MAYEKIELELRDDGVAVLRLNDPGVLNAIGADMLDDLMDAAQALSSADNVRAVLLTANGRGFCAGANLTDPRRGSGGGGGSVLRDRYHPLFFRLRDLPVPIVSAVNGVAAGVGMSLALFGDMVCCGRSAYFLQAFAKIGLVPDGGATWLLPRLVGRARALELSLLAERLPAEQALEWGLVNRVFDDDALFDESLALAQRLARGPMSLGLIRQLYWDSWSNSYESQLDLEAKLQNRAAASADAAEGGLAFREKRDPQFTGR